MGLVGGDNASTPHDDCPRGVGPLSEGDDEFMKRLIEGSPSPNQAV